MAKKKFYDTSEAPLTTCCECGKKGEVVIGPAGKGRCNSCIQKSNKESENHKKGFVNDIGTPTK